MANVLDVLFLVVFGVWGYVVAKRKRRDEVGWAMAAAIAFFLPGYAMQEAIFPALAKSAGWPESWQKPFGFIVGGVCALVVDVVLTFFLRPLPAPEAGGGEEPPAGEGGTSGPEPGGESSEAPPTEPPAQQMAVATPQGGATATALEPRALLERFWPAAIPLVLLVAAFAPTVGQMLLQEAPADPTKDPRYFLLVPVIGLFFWRLRGRPVEGILAALFTLMYVPAIAWMLWRWGRGSSYYSHGYLIPLVVGALVWRLRDRLREMVAKDDFRVFGLSVLAAGLLLLIGATFVRVFFLQAVSMVVALCGLVFFLSGRAISRLLLFPLAFTIAMVPLPMHMISGLTLKLKMFASEASVRIVDLLRAIGLHSYVVVRDGSYIRWDTMGGEGGQVGFDEIIIGDVCSGLRSLIALLAFGALFAYVAKLSRTRKLILFAASVPIAVLANMWRIVTLTFIACRWGSESAHGFVHDVTGYGIFVIAFILFFGFERFLRRFEPGESEGGPPVPEAAPPR